jgi:hypothetical protein
MRIIRMMTMCPFDLSRLVPTFFAPYRQKSGHLRSTYGMY